MIRSGLVAVIFLAFTAIVIAIFLGDIVTLSEGTRTDAAQEAGLTCTTGVGETTCTITLPAEHEYPDTTGLTVTETSPGAGDWTANTTVSTDRVTLTITGLTASTVYVFTANYLVLAPGISNVLNGFLRLLPVLVVLGGVGVVVAALARALGTFR